jgi:hypothetical protein
MDHEKWLEQHDRMIADLRLAHEKAKAEHDHDVAEIRGLLRRAIHDSVREARTERRKRRELDDKITQLAAAQLITEEKFQQLLERDKRRYGENGNQPPTS